MGITGLTVKRGFFFKCPEGNRWNHLQFLQCSNILSSIRREKIKTVILHPLGWLTTRFPTCTLHNSCSHLHQTQQSRTMDTSDVSLMAFRGKTLVGKSRIGGSQLNSSFQCVSPEWFLLRGLILEAILFLKSSPSFYSIVFLEDLPLVCHFIVVLLYFGQRKRAWLTRSRPADWLISWIIISRSATTATALLSLFGSDSANFMQMFSDSPAHYFVFCLSDVGLKITLLSALSPESDWTHLGETIDFLGAVVRMMFAFCFGFFCIKTFKAKICEGSHSSKSSPGTARWID